MADVCYAPRPDSSILLTGPDIFALERHLRIRELLVAYPAFRRDDSRITKRAEKGELGSRVHIELSPALEPPRQLLLGLRVLRSLTGCVHASEPRRKRVGKIIRLFGGQATRVRLRRHLHSVVQRHGRDFP